MWPFSFSGRMRPLPYALWSLAVFFSQHLLVILVFTAQEGPLKPDWWFFFIPLRALVTHAKSSDATLLLGFAYLLIVAWALAALAFRRAADAGITEWIAAAAIAPFIQVPVIAALGVAPSRAADAVSPAADRAQHSDWTDIVYGVIACVGLTLIAVATGTLLFSVYGFGVFVVSPFIIGAVTAYFANFHADIGGKRTAQVLVGAMALAGIGLVLFSLEGVVCIVLLAPLAFGIAMIGASFGRAIAVSARRPRTHTVSAVALLPVVFALEALLPAQTSFDSHQTIDIDAPPQAVWNSILHMDRIDEPLTLLLRLGIAHPLRGEIFGEGVGAMRHGEFSTGTAIERVTEWAPNQKLAFAVLNDIPAMRELSPYQHVHAPHVIGFFRTSDTSFELEQLGGNRTRIVERTSHQLRLEPVLYWLPMARWVVHENNARVLRHIKRLSEVRYQRSEIGDQISTSE